MCHHTCLHPVFLLLWLACRVFYYQKDLAGAHIDQAVLKDLVTEKLPKVMYNLNEYPDMKRGSVSALQMMYIDFTQVAAHFKKLNFQLESISINW